MNKKFDLLVFDWDGTLVDSAGAIISSIKNAARDAELPEPSNIAARYVIGLGLREAAECLFPAISPQKFELLSNRYRHHYLALDSKISPFKGVIKIIETLHKKKFLLAVATGKSRAGFDRSLESSGLKNYFHSSRCADETSSKPNPLMLFELMEQFNIEAERTLMIGDTTHDLQMAINARVAGLGVTYGAHSRKNIESLTPFACVDSIMDLSSWLNTNL
ncbi:MAG: HAD-IA family hydrolase [Nitrosospira sp.]|nr:HAD-IA family hydrolase [Nitrosospira sp.]MDW7665546.1 HAD-IA family hydrolase [Nitrosomonadaceae bacterium]MBI0415653.1 HAD-IA family hydrolase [Nitrosospira sp.]MBI0416321.1 HAD-IA family hydrolase [Nitrosospira sp.]MBI0418093.1 HAD-IA family hydrolase [Nitrosospira sp.]